jgi:hypothetical protein
MSNAMRPAYLVLPELEQLWYQNAQLARERFVEAIGGYEREKMPISALLCRCGLVQLLRGYNAQFITGLNLTEEQLRKEAGA